MRPTRRHGPIVSCARQGRDPDSSRSGEYSSCWANESARGQLRSAALIKNLMGSSFCRVETEHLTILLGCYLTPSVMVVSPCPCGPSYESCAFQSPAISTLIFAR